MSNFGSNGSEDMPNFTLGWISEDERKLLEHLSPQQAYASHAPQQVYPTHRHLQLLQISSNWIYDTGGQWNIPTTETTSYLKNSGQDRPTLLYGSEEHLFHENEYVTNHQRQASLISQIFSSPNLTQDPTIQPLQRPPQSQNGLYQLQYNSAQYQGNLHLEEVNQIHQRQLLHPEYSIHLQLFQPSQQPPNQPLHDLYLATPVFQQYQFPLPSRNIRRGESEADSNPDRGKIFVYPYDESGPYIGKLSLVALPTPYSVSEALLQCHEAELELVVLSTDRNSKLPKGRPHRKRRRNPDVDIGWAPLPIASLFSDSRVQFTARQKEVYMRRMKHGVLGVINMRSKGAWTRGPNKKH